MNALPGLASGTARAISRRLPNRVDLLALYAQLSDHGRRPDTMLLETRAGASIILDRAAVRIECRGADIALDALSANGRPVLDLVKRNLADKVASSSADRLTLRFERSVEVDAERRLLAASPFDVLRAITSGVRSETPEEPMTVCLVGVVAFDHVDLFEELPPSAEDPTGFPDFIFWLAESAIVGDPGLTPRLICTSFGVGRGRTGAAQSFFGGRAARRSRPPRGRRPWLEGDRGDAGGNLRRSRR